MGIVSEIGTDTLLWAMGEMYKRGEITKKQLAEAYVRNEELPESKRKNNIKIILTTIDLKPTADK